MQILLFIVLLIVLIGIISGTLMFWSLRYPESSMDSVDIPYLSIIIPARNEEKRLPFLLESLNKQNWKAYEILVVDDDSEDRTAAIAKEYAANVIKNEAAGLSTKGKSAACALGAEHAKGHWLLFLDADVQLVNENSLKRLLSAYQEQSAKGILSVQPYHRIAKPYENLSAIFNIIVLTGINVFTVWKQRMRTAGSFGPCILCDKDSYVLTGGHESAKESIMDDFALSERFTANHLPVTNYGGKGILNFRMYPEGTLQLIEGWTKNFATASKSTHWFVMLLISLWICGAFMAAAYPIIAFVTSSTVHISISILTYLLYGVHVFFLGRRAGNFSSLVIILFPFLFLFFTIVFLYSFYRTHILRSVKWKGRKMKV